MLDVVLSQLERLELGDLSVVEPRKDLPESSIRRVDLVRSFSLPSVCGETPLLQNVEGRDAGEAGWR